MYIINQHGHYFHLQCSIDISKLINFKEFSTLEELYSYIIEHQGLSKDEVEGTEFIISYDNCYKILEFGFQESSLDLKSTIEDFINEYTL